MKTEMHSTRGTDRTDCPTRVRVVSTTSTSHHHHTQPRALPQMFTGSLDAAERRLELLVGAALRLRLVVLTTLTRILHVSPCLRVGLLLRHA
jgi:hypothetical protein